MRTPKDTQLMVGELIVLASLLLCPNLHAATINAASVSRADVAAAIALAVDGVDTVVVPAGIASWTNTLNVTKGITIQGAGIGQTIIIDDIIRDPANAGSTEQVLRVNLTALQRFRLTGIEFTRGRTTGYLSGVVSIIGSGVSNRIDHCKWNQVANRAWTGKQATFGVIDNCIFIMGAVGGGQSLEFKGTTLFGKNYGDGPWQRDVAWGSKDFWYAEDNYFEGAGIDAFDGALFVCRFNVFFNARIGNHGTESTQRYRSCRGFEAYGNALSCNVSSSIGIDLRGGGAIICSNTLTTVGSGSYSRRIFFDNYRGYYSFSPWGGANGENAFDKNVAGAPFQTGAHDGGTVANGTMVDQTKSWTTGQWDGFSVINLATGRFSFISGNTATTISFRYDPGSQALAFSNGQTYNFTRVDQAFDQVGTGRTDPLPQIVSVPASNYNQQTDILYIWQNTLNSVIENGVRSARSITEGRDFTNGIARSGWIPYTYPHPLREEGAPSAPNAPSSLLATAISSSAINLTWLDNSANELRFIVERSLEAAANYVQIALLTPNTVNYSDTGLSASTTYYYRVRAENDTGNSAYSASSSAATSASVSTAPRGRRVGIGMVTL